MANPKCHTSTPKLSNHANKTSWSTTAFLYILSYRLLNALLLQTFFQPDEYYQSLEPAWHLAFGPQSGGGFHDGAWITWEWRSQLRSSLIPFLFAAAYRFSSLLASLLKLDDLWRAELLVVTPKVVMAFFAAGIDFFTWKLAQKVSRGERNVSMAVLVLSLCSPWQFFVGTRSLANGIETALTGAALYYWPLRRDVVEVSRGDGLWEWRGAIVLAATATILRPTNVIVWAVVCVVDLGSHVRVSMQHAVNALVVYVREISCCGLAVIAVSACADRLFYQQWVFPPYRFLYFNIVQSLAVFYGSNRLDYYFTEGLPLLLTTALPFAVEGIVGGVYNAFRQKGWVKTQSSETNSEDVYATFSATVIVMTVALSSIAHKEVRFIYPLLPILHVLAGERASARFGSLLSLATRTKRILFPAIIVFNVCLAAYVSLVHQRGVIDVVGFLRQDYEQRSFDAGLGKFTEQAPVEMTVGFLMPCHSTPWRSHLVYAGIEAWALTCEPPLEVDKNERAGYRDEADQFYDDPTQWLALNMVATPRETQGNDGQTHKGPAGMASRTWPDRLVFFEQLEPFLKDELAQSSYRQCWRGFNTHFHDDWRRKGDVIVWCKPSV